MVVEELVVILLLDGYQVVVVVGTRVVVVVEQTLLVQEVVVEVSSLAPTMVNRYKGQGPMSMTSLETDSSSSEKHRPSCFRSI
jgi:hypothetical protein